MMGDSSQSSRRRHILSSINPDPPREQRRQRSQDALRQHHEEPEPVASSSSKRRQPQSPEDGAGHDGTDTTQPRRSRLKLKDHKSRHRSSRNRDRDGDDDATRRSHRRHHRHRRRSRSPTPPNPYEPKALDPDAAFRESLFDAMADDEGAAYWEGVYGQPVHVYSNEKAGPAGELERMTDEEYTAFVRQKMWEKTHAGLLEERERRAQERKRKAEEERHNRKLQKEMEESLQRGEERRRRKAMQVRGAEYGLGQRQWNGTADGIDWPVFSGRSEDIDDKNVREFYLEVLGLGLGAIDGPVSLLSSLKDERVRWHPDKIQQRLGGKVDEETMKDVTKVFQIIDNFWSETRAKAASQKT